ncbi:hypothetical protein RFI_09123 [Reticulomyxa filosa]|uniref:Uncharacterized protein n=1 Tax=Reticulomyxa filosa TaxID=46433 RepID=X6NP09_RETFI|nr:hypothetical protein RFI_09123 [Reticulomyxa filosa]|eukprot:ETO28010.1 hypothetical protein RFI_09123 [Reticulomyxa filosa]
MSDYSHFCEKLGYNPLQSKPFAPYITSAIIIEWLVVNEAALTNRAQCTAIYNSMLTYVCGGNTRSGKYIGILETANAGHLLCLSDEMLIWQHECLALHGFLICKKWEDLHLFDLPFPTRSYMFIKSLRHDTAFSTKREDTQNDIIQQKPLLAKKID